MVKIMKYYLIYNCFNLGRERPGDSLIQSGADSDAVDENGDTPLHWAVQYGNLIKDIW